MENNEGESKDLFLLENEEYRNLWKKREDTILERKNLGLTIQSIELQFATFKEEIRLSTLSGIVYPSKEWEEQKRKHGEILARLRRARYAHEYKLRDLSILNKTINELNKSIQLLGARLKQEYIQKMQGDKNETK